jgi:hypothetical protein
MIYGDNKIRFALALRKIYCLQYVYWLEFCWKINIFYLFFLPLSLYHFFVLVANIAYIFLKMSDLSQNLTQHLGGKMRSIEHIRMECP